MKNLWEKSESRGRKRGTSIIGGESYTFHKWITALRARAFRQTNNRIKTQFGRGVSPILSGQRFIREERPLYNPCSLECYSINVQCIEQGSFTARRQSFDAQVIRCKRRKPCTRTRRQNGFFDLSVAKRLITETLILGVRFRKISVGKLFKISDQNVLQSKFMRSKLKFTFSGRCTNISAL